MISILPVAHFLAGLRLFSLSPAPSQLVDILVARRLFYSTLPGMCTGVGEGGHAHAKKITIEIQQNNIYFLGEEMGGSRVEGSLTEVICNRLDL